MKPLFVSLAAMVAAASLVIAGCTQAAPAPTPTKAPAAPTRAAEPTKAPAASTKAPEPTKAAAPQPTAAPAKKVDYPQKGKTITFIVPWGAGGGTDVGARLLAVPLEKELGVPIQVVNKPGGNSQTGVTELAMARPDGYTIGMTNLPSSITPYLEPERKAAYGRKDLQPVANHVNEAESIAVKGDSPFKTLKDLVDAGKANPEKIKFSASGIASDNHLANLLFQKMAGVKFTIVNVDSGAQQVTALLGGHVEANLMTPGTLIPQVKSGEIRLLGYMDRQRSKFFPDVPTFEEQGYRIYYGSSRGVSVPAGTPREIVEILSAAIKKAMDDPEHKKKMDEMALPLRYMDSAEYAAYWDEFDIQTKQLMESARQ